MSDNQKTPQITVVGVGALGSHVVQFLRNVEANISVIDFDRIEQKNVQSQFHTKPSVGKNKAQSLQQSMQFLFGVKVGAIPHKLTSQNDDQLLAGATLIIDCLDNGEARRIVQNFSRSAHTACLHGALAADGTLGRIVWDQDFQIDEVPAGAKATCEDGQHLPFIGMVAAQIAQSAKEFLTTKRQRSWQVTLVGVSRI